MGAADFRGEADSTKGGFSHSRTHVGRFDTVDDGVASELQKGIHQGVGDVSVDGCVGSDLFDLHFFERAFRDGLDRFGHTVENDGHGGLADRTQFIVG